MRIALEMPEATVRALSGIARSEDTTVGQIIRNAVLRDLKRRAKPKSSGKSDAALVASLRSLLANDLADARSWVGLQERLGRHHLALRPAGGGLIVVSTIDGQIVCKASELGSGHAQLARQMGHAFPNHPHAHLFAKSQSGRDDHIVIDK